MDKRASDPCLARRLYPIREIDADANKWGTYRIPLFGVDGMQRRSPNYIHGEHLMKYRKYIILILALFLVNVTHVKADGVKLETLLKTQLEGVEGTEVIVSKVHIPANTSLRKHWHPGEEFVYILEGSVTLWQEGKDNITGKKGEVIKIPLKQIHTGITGDEGADVLVFRVHEKGKPERVIVE